MTEKFNVFDFFNLIIVGMIFITILGISNFYNAINLIKKISKAVLNNNLLEMSVIIVSLCVALIAGMLFQVIFQYMIKEKFQKEEKALWKKLNNGKLFDNEIRMNELLKEAKKYLNIKKSERSLTDKQWSAFFAHCIYYLQIKNLDKKTEKLYETEGLSGLLACTFFSAALSNVVIIGIQKSFFYNMVDLKIIITQIVLGIIIYTILGIILYFRYIFVNRSRIKMVFSIYITHLKIERMERKL